MFDTDRLSDLLATGEHLPDPLPESPLPLLHAWYREAIAARGTPNPDAMVLSTTGIDGFPNSRIVLCKRLDPHEGVLVFFTNTASRKGVELDADPRAAALFHWDFAGRQARLRGRVVLAPERESDEYFATRPLVARLGAWASEQSQPIDSPLALAGRILERMVEFRIAPENLAEGEDILIPRPPYWSGFHFQVESVELWTGRAGRLHDRAGWIREHRNESGGPAESDVPARWRVSRLQP